MVRGQRPFLFLQQREQYYVYLKRVERACVGVREGFLCSPADVAVSGTLGSTASGPPKGSGWTQDMGIVLHSVPPHVPHPAGQHSMLSSSRTPSTIPQGAPVIGSAEVGHCGEGH